jgi:hypothetical protein
MFVIELVIPFLIFCGRKGRLVACAIFIPFQLIIILTGNYTFFNWLTMVLCLTLLDDEVLRRVLPPNPLPTPNRPRAAHWRWKLTLPLALLVVLMTARTLPLGGGWPHPLTALYVWFEPFRIFDSYGLFANMTLTRPEIILEGSNDGKAWQDYEFKFKPGDLKRRPGFVAPCQPRLDWQMWFAALEDVQHNPWVVGLEWQLLQNSPSTTNLLARNPFPDKPPKLIRAELYQYHFTDFATRRATGQWWRRQYEGLYVPPLTLADFKPPAGS